LAHRAPATIHFYSRGADGNRDRRWHHAPFWTGWCGPRWRPNRPGPHDALVGSSADQCHCGGVRL